MFKDLAQSIEGVTLLAEIGLILFVLIFALVVFRAFSIKKSDRQYAKSLPLEDN